MIAMAVFWGSAFAMSKVAVEAVPPTVAAFLRFGVGAVIMLGMVHIRERKPRAVLNGSWRSVALLGLLGVAGYNWLLFLGLSFSKASDGSMIIPTMSPVITVVLAACFLKEHLKRNQVIGLLLALAGSGIFFSAIGWGGIVEWNRIFGDGLFFLAAVCWASYTLLGKRVLGQADPLPVTAYSMSFGSLALAVLAIPDLGQVDWGELGLSFWLNQLYLSLFPTVLANWFYYRGVKEIGAARASAFMYLVPVSGLFWAGIMLGDVLQPVQLTGAGVMMAGVWMINRRLSDRSVSREARSVSERTQDRPTS
ncbi:hypothetical protein CHM34_02060 [Paludifilum halophilum]|uniref:EamA domain-containing protein n=1 Tax=Paludifilum halophilum TaxID=1642702 RepID=A0A235BCL7_9BACL|nr:DMT family transporter [Paludifilum halophilum]OYD09799.1 hypothetical protein CHM34_02060 [Paludifilum halophilum]